MLFAIAMFILLFIFVFLFVTAIVIICVTSAQNKEGKTAPTAPVQMPVAKAPMTNEEKGKEMAKQYLVMSSGLSNPFAETSPIDEYKKHLEEEKYAAERERELQEEEEEQEKEEEELRRLEEEREEEWERNDRNGDYFINLADTL